MVKKILFVHLAGIALVAVLCYLDGLCLPAKVNRRLTEMNRAECLNAAECRAFAQQHLPERYEQNQEYARTFGHDTQDVHIPVLGEWLAADCVAIDTIGIPIIGYMIVSMFYLLWTYRRSVKRQGTAESVGSSGHTAGRS